MMKKFLCPKCGKHAMIKKEIGTKKYVFICSQCGYKPRILLKKDKKKDIV